MYDELVKRLRNCAAQAAPCDACGLIGDISCSDNLMKQAADAIEELQKAVYFHKHNSEFWEDKYNSLADEKWIPVEERLPEEYVNVLCYYEYYRYGEYNCMFRTIDRGYYGDGIWGGEAGQGHKNKVLAWMPLPQPPKEET